ncbi:hypothetical protein [Flavihumibacter petaseus]|nr:hypothetical protein [Flavihumibacter petaseus]
MYRQIVTPKLFRLRWLVSAMAVFFMCALASSLVSLPFSSRQNRSTLLNAVEEEAAGSNNNFNEEHKCGKSLHSNFLDMSAYLERARKATITFEIPRSVDLGAFPHIRRIIQPPEC